MGVIIIKDIRVLVIFPRKMKVFDTWIEKMEKNSHTIKHWRVHSMLSCMGIIFNFFFRFYQLQNHSYGCNYYSFVSNCWGKIKNLSISPAQISYIIHLYEAGEAKFCTIFNNGRPRQTKARYRQFIHSSKQLEKRGKQVGG